MALKAIRASGRGNITYYHGKAKDGSTFALLRGGGMREADAKTYAKSQGFYWQERIGMRAIMAWRRDSTTLAEFAASLAYLKHIGFNIIPAKNLPPAKQFPIGEWNAQTRTLTPPVTVQTSKPTALFKMLALFRGQKVELASVKRWIDDNGYSDVNDASDLDNETMQPGNYRDGSQGIFVCSFGTPQRRLFLGFSNGILNSIRQWNGRTWGQLTACRLYGRNDGT